MQEAARWINPDGDPEGDPGGDPESNPEGGPFDDERLTRLSPARFDHVNRYGRYRFDIEEESGRTGLRPLREVCPRQTTRFCSSATERPFCIVF